MRYIQSVSDEARIFLYSMGFGTILCALYGSLRFFGISFKLKRVGTFILDILFCVICAFLSFIFVLTVNRGRMGFYIYSGEALGFFICYLCFSEFMQALMAKIVNIQKAVFYSIKKPFTLLNGKIYLKSKKEKKKIKETYKKV